ncbi:MAG: hypothetical protein LC808_44295, partial [Actinobacteria bacterium]|nr:hypothetical protein [Actinomycetota bacterium]
ARPSLVVEAGVTVRAAGLTRSLRPLTIGADEETNPPTSHRPRPPRRLTPHRSILPPGEGDALAMDEAHHSVVKTANWWR